MYTIEEFISKSKEKITEYRNREYKHVVNVKDITTEDIQIVWISKTLHHMKGLFIGHVTDGLYYELTYNGINKELYMDVYDKQENLKFEI